MSESYKSSVEPDIGGLVEVEVSAWGYWNVWISVESYYSSDANTAMHPGEAVRVAWRLMVAAVVCWWKRLPDQAHGRLREAKDGAP